MGRAGLGSTPVPRWGGSGGHRARPAMAAHTAGQIRTTQPHSRAPGHTPPAGFETGFGAGACELGSAPPHNEPGDLILQAPSWRGGERVPARAHGAAFVVGRLCCSFTTSGRLVAVSGETSHSCAEPATSFSMATSRLPPASNPPGLPAPPEGPAGGPPCPAAPAPTGRSGVGWGWPFVWGSSCGRPGCRGSRGLIPSQTRMA